MPDITDNIVRDGGGQPVVPFGVEKPLAEVPKDTLPRPTPSPTVPAIQPEMIQEQVQSKAIEGMTTYEELAAAHGFKSPEDLAKSYKELRSQNSRVEATLSDAIKARQEFYEPQILPKAEEVDNTEDALRIVDARIAKQVRGIQDAYDYKIHILENPEDKQFASQAIQYVKDNPGIRWDIAFKAAKADYLALTEREKGRQEAYQSIEKKEQAQSMHSSQRTPTEAPIKDIIEGIKTGKIPLSQAKQFINNLTR